MHTLWLVFTDVVVCGTAQVGITHSIGPHLHTTIGLGRLRLAREPILAALQIKAPAVIESDPHLQTTEKMTGKRQDSFYEHGNDTSVNDLSTAYIILRKPHIQIKQN